MILVSTSFDSGDHILHLVMRDVRRNFILNVAYIKFYRILDLLAEAYLEAFGLLALARFASFINLVKHLL